MGNGLYLTGTVSSLLLILMKILFALFILGFFAGLVVWIKDNIFTPEERRAIKNTFTGNGFKKEVCKRCGKELNHGWKSCPYCSTPKENGTLVNG